MIYIGTVIAFIIPIGCYLFIIYGPEKFTVWECQHHSVTVWFGRICAICGSIMMGIGGVQMLGWPGAFLPCAVHLVIFIIGNIIKHFEKR